MNIEPCSFEAQKFDFEAIEAAVRETERGRWFLAEYDRRSRSSDIRMLLDAIGKFEGSIKATPRQPPAPQLRPALAETIHKTKAEIEAIKANILPLQACSSSSSTFGYLGVQAKAIAAELTQLSQVMQLTGDSFRDDPEGMSGAVSHLSKRLLDIARMQNALSTAVEKGMSLLDHLDSESAGEHGLESVANRLETLAADLPRLGGALSEDNCRYFGKDEELFTQSDPPRSEPVLQGEISGSSSVFSLKLNESPARVLEEEVKARIVVVRTPSSAAMPIPLAEGAPEPMQETAA